MRELYIEDKAVELSTDETIEIERRSSLFEHDKLQGSFSVQFTLPYGSSAVNRNIFFFSGTPGTGRGTFLKFFSFQFSGCEVASGTLEAELYGENVEAAFLLEGGDFNSRFADKKLNELDLGTKQLNPYRILYTPDVDTVAFAGFSNTSQHKNTHWEWADRQIPTSVMVWYSNMVKDGKLLTSDDDYSESLTNDGDIYRIKEYNYTNCPQVYLSGLIRNLLKAEGFSLEYSFLELEEFKGLALFSAYDINEYKGGTPDRVPKPFDISSILPNKTVKELITAVQAFFNASLIFNGKSAKLVLNSDILTAKETEQLPASFTVTSIAPNSYDGHKIGQEFDSSDFTPYLDLTGEMVYEDSVSDVENHNKKQEGYILRTEDRYVYKGEPKELFNTLDLGKQKLVKVSVSKPQPIKSGNGKLEVMSGLSAIGHNDEGVGVSVSCVNRTYIRKTFDSFRIGYVRDSDDGTYSIFARHNKKMDLVDIERGYNGHISLRKRCWTVWEDWLFYRRKFEAEIHGAQAWNFLRFYSADKKYRDADGQAFMITEVVESYAHDRVLTVKVKGWTI